MASQLMLQACASGPAFGLHQALDDGAVLQEAGSATGIARMSRGGDLHATCIGAPRRSGNPWRE